jgi:DNA-binding response OmpR family regulator
MPDTRTAVVIEDDADVGRLVQTVLSATGMQVRLAATGTAGVAAVRAHCPDLVVLDYGLPDITGLEVIRLIRSFSAVQILMLTGHDDLEETLLSAGASAVMTKPFRVRELREQVEKMRVSHLEEIRGL